MTKRSLEQRVSDLEASALGRPDQLLRWEALNQAVCASRGLGVDVVAEAEKYFKFLRGK